MASLYVHFPFCASKCIYCDFYSRVGKDWTGYTDALLREISERRDELQGVPPTTLYFGGGTPSLLPARLLAHVADTIQTHFGIKRLEEFTIEVNSDDVTDEKAVALRAAGATRISMGVQSFCDKHLQWMRRRHTAADAEAAFRRLRRAGFDNLSLDLIFGFTGLSREDWDHTISQALELRPEHISCYQMTGRWADSDEERCRAQYERLQQRLDESGYLQYELSNYALPGRASRHNSAYWLREPYLGFGAGAHSFDGNRRRYWNTPDIDAYITHRPGGEEKLSDRDIFEEKILLALRTVQGLSLSGLTTAEQEMLSKKKPVMERLSKTGKLVYNDCSLRIPAGERFVSDYIIRELFPD